MNLRQTQRWLDALGYSRHGALLHTVTASVPAGHAYASELRALLDPEGLIRATAVFDVQGVPTICFVESAGRPEGWIDEVRQRIWNQNLVTIVLTIEAQQLTAYSPLRSAQAHEVVAISEAAAEGRLSAADVQSGDVWARQPTWFQRDHRVDTDLLENLGAVINLLVEEEGLDRSVAQLLLGQALFVSYLEHRGIVGDTYRTENNVGEFQDLVRRRDREGLAQLFNSLSVTFNGDFLAPAVSSRTGWARLTDGIFEKLIKFLGRVDMRTGQGSLWNYDFSFVPVELLSGIYETFIDKDQQALGAYYTPRHLANLAVDLAFDGIANPTREIVYDGACGSGILLTTAFRRMLGYAQAQRGSPLPWEERITLLTSHIFGSDLSEPACRVTAFSLYLSLLEDLIPSDIALLTSDPRTKLPKLLDHTIFHGRREGDFFSTKNPLAVVGRCTIVLSNPPWREPGGSESGLTYETWLQRAGRRTARRQIAGAFAHKAGTLVPPTGKVVLIMPISMMLASTSQPFVRNWLQYMRPELMVNFGDLRRQLFPKAKHGCAVVVARPRAQEQLGRIPADEQFAYWAPKVDVSLAFGRLSLHTGDRHAVPTQHWYEDNLRLRILTWGGREDFKLIGRLQLAGRITDLEESHGWQLVKGFNRTRRGSPKLDPTPLAKKRFLDARNIPADQPTLPTSHLEPFPADITSVVSYGSHNGRAFRGPRVLFPDGISDSLQLRAVFTSKQAVFKHTITAICGSKRDEDVLRFLAVYLRSGLVSYLALHTAFSPATERERITVDEVSQLPFVHPDEHENPKRAWKIVREVANATRSFEESDVILSPDWNDEQYEPLISEYFGLNEVERALIAETIEWALPSRQVADPARLLTPWQAAPNVSTIKAYTKLLKHQLQQWRDVRGGRGHFEIQATLGMRNSRRGVGIVQIKLTQSRTKASPEVVSQGLEAVQALIDQLVRQNLLPMQVSENIFLSADYLVVCENTAYLIKPLANRLWRPSQAARDARQLVERTNNETIQ